MAAGRIRQIELAVIAPGVVEVGLGYRRRVVGQINDGAERVVVVEEARRGGGERISGGWVCETLRVIGVIPLLRRDGVIEWLTVLKAALRAALHRRLPVSGWYAGERGSFRAVRDIRTGQVGRPWDP